MKPTEGDVDRARFVSSDEATSGGGRVSQQMEALAIAQAVRMGQAEVRRSLIAGGVDRAIELLLDPDDVAGSMRLDRFLASLHYYGAYRSMKLLDRAGMHRARLHRRVRELTDQERQRLADELEEGRQR